MKRKAIPQAKQPSVMNPFWIGICLIVVGVLKILDVVTGFVAETAVMNQSSLVLFSMVFIVMGSLLLVFDRLLKRPKKGRQRLRQVLEEENGEASSKQSGFTLIEMLIAIALVALVFAMISGVLISVLNTNNGIRERVDAEKIGHGVLGLLQRELQGCLAYGLGPVVFKGESKSLAGHEADEIFFVTAASGDVFRNDSNQSNQVGSSKNRSANQNAPQNRNKPNRRPKTGPIYRKVGYVVRQAPESSGPTRLLLCRRSVAYTKEDRDVTSGGGAPFVEVVDGLVGFKLEYRDGEEGSWQDAWEETSRLPRAIRISVSTAVPERQILAANAEGRAAPAPRRYQTIVSVFASTDIPEADKN